MHRFTNMVLGSLAFGSIGLAAAAAQAQCGQWIVKASIPTPRSGFTTGVLGSRVYCAGGYPFTGVLQAYDAAGNSWSTLASAPVATEARGASLDGLLYVTGGNAGGFCSNVLEVYNPVANTWAMPPAMPTPRCHVATASVNGLLYVMGGTNTSGSFVYNTVEAFNPATNTWSTRAPMPTARSGANAAVVDGVVYVLGGGGGGNIFASVDAYDPATNTWSPRAAMSSPRSAPGVCECNGLMYVLGGQTTGGGFLSSVEAYDPATNTWSARPAMHDPRAGAGAVALHGVIYAIGGGNATGALSSVEAYSECNPVCRADFNGSGSATVQDIFDFLTAWFAGCP